MKASVLAMHCDTTANVQKMYRFSTECPMKSFWGICNIALSLSEIEDVNYDINNL